MKAILWFRRKYKRGRLKKYFKMVENEMAEAEETSIEELDDGIPVSYTHLTLPTKA